MKIKVVDGAFCSVPTRFTSGSSGLDLVCAHDVIVTHDKPVLVKTGIKVEVPRGYECQVRPRSGLFLKHDVLAFFGTIDSDYRGEVHVGLYMCGTRFDEVRFSAGSRIAQLVVCKVEIPSVLFVTELSETDRGSGGFGSTGI